jgi:hypothetical protein
MKEVSNYLCGMAKIAIKERCEMSSTGKHVVELEAMLGRLFNSILETT